MSDNICKKIKNALETAKAHNIAKTVINGGGFEHENPTLHESRPLVYFQINQTTLITGEADFHSPLVNYERTFLQLGNIEEGIEITEEEGYKEGLVWILNNGLRDLLGEIRKIADDHDMEYTDSLVQGGKYDYLLARVSLTVDINKISKKETREAGAALSQVHNRIDQYLDTLRDTNNKHLIYEPREF